MFGDSPRAGVKARLSRVLRGRKLGTLRPQAVRSRFVNSLP